MSTELTTVTPGWIGKAWARLSCWRGKHAPDRKRVRKDGMFYVGKCKTCGTPIRKRKDRPWRAFKP